VVEHVASSDGRSEGNAEPAEPKLPLANDPHIGAVEFSR
jgi:hypothetical protein